MMDDDDYDHDDDDVDFYGLKERREELKEKLKAKY